MATTSLPTAAAQKRAIHDLEAKARMEPGAVWCIIDGKWYGKWRSWIAGELFGGAPGAIDNSSLLDSDKLGLRPGLVESTDFHVIPETVWNKFEAWYGGGPKLSRTVIVQGEETFVEVAPPIFRVQTAARPTAVMPVSLSKQAPVRELKRRAVEALRLSPAEADALVMVSVFDGPETRVLDQPDVSIEDARLVTGQSIRLQAPTKATASPTSPPKSASAAAVVTGTRNAGAQLGVCGLSNLGNTCFMNSALQCLSATPALREFFLTGRFTAEINRNNPIGAKGQLAEQFGELLQNMWNGKASFAPRDLKWTIGKFAPRFSGYQQQDAQELLAFLLDGLHEDLNRVLTKPYIPTPAEEGAVRPDAQVAAEAWERHLKRNQSIIVDLFQAQLKSTVRCPDCQLVSVTFDPFMYLGLPLPSTRQQSFDIIACLDERGCCKYGVSVDVRATVMSLKTELSNLLSPQVPPSRIWITDISKNCITMKWDDNRAASDLPKKVFAYIIPQAGAKPLRQIQVIQRVQAETVPGQPVSMKTYGMPCLVHVTPGTTTAADAYAALLARFAPILRNASAFAPGGPFPFALAIVDQRGIGCGACKAATCGGCPLPPTATPLNEKIPAIALDWLPIANRNLDEENRTRVDPSAKRAGNGSENSRTLSLQQCLTNFCNSEQLGPQDLWYCPRCKTHRQAFKRMELFTAPEYLVIHLKRFAFSQSMRNKIDTVVEFPVDGLNLAPFLQSAPRGPEIYDLYAISNHMGGLGGGHYTAHIKSPNGQWFLMNDSTYQPVRDMRELQTANAYLLFYARRHMQAPPPEIAPNGSEAAAASDAKRRRADE